MTLIKKKDVKNYFAARRKGKPFHVRPVKESDATLLSGVENLEIKASIVGEIEAPESPSPLATPLVPVITSELNPGNNVEPVAKRRA